MSRAILATVVLAAVPLACGGSSTRGAEITGVMARADEPLIRARPRLVAGKYERMAASPYDFFRGTLPLYLHDARWNNFGLGASAFALDGPLVPALGDPHPENFGTLLAEDGALALEPNDFDSADLAPYLRDVRRLVAGMALAARLTNEGDPAANEATAQASRPIARAAAEGYAEAIAALAQGSAREPIVAASGDRILADLFTRAARDLADRAELSELTVLENGARRLRRGVLSTEEPTNLFLDLPAPALAALPEAIARYRESLVDPPEPAYFTLLDAARELGSGVASWPRVRVILLVRGPSDAPGDDVLLELKELSDSGIAGLYPQGVHYDDVGERVLRSARATWARPDAEPLWGATRFLGLPCQIKRESEAQKTLRVRRMSGARGTAEALTSLARRLGGLLARAHAAEPRAGLSSISEIRRVIERDAVAFADEQADVGDRYAAQVLVDHALWRDALLSLGPRLGVPLDPSDAPSPDLRALFADDHAP